MKTEANPQLTEHITSVSSVSSQPAQITYLKQKEKRPRLKKGTSISELSAEFSKEPEFDSLLSEARTWISNKIGLGKHGKTLRTIRLEQGLSQAKLAEMLGLKQPHVSRIEKGKDNLTLETLRNLKAALNIDMNTLEAAIRAQELENRDMESKNGV